MRTILQSDTLPVLSERSATEPAVEQCAVTFTTRNATTRTGQSLTPSTNPPISSL